MKIHGLKLCKPKSSESKFPLVFISKRFGFEWWNTKHKGRFIRIGFLCLRWGAA